MLASGASCCAGIPWLFANLALASFIKFKDSPATAIAVTVVLGVGCMYFFLSHGRWLRYVSGSHTEMQSHLKVTDTHSHDTFLSVVEATMHI